MIRRSPWKILVPVVVAVGVLGTGAAIRAQNATTGTLGGVVRDAQRGVLPGASVVATHAPTGTRYEAFTRGDGRFDLLNVQVGPYDLEIALGGFGTQALSGVVVALGEATEVPVTLQLAALTETVEVTAEASALFSPSRSGTTAGVETGLIETLPTLERSLQDFARTNPFFVKTNSNADDESFLSVAGRSGRYNNIQIDGAVNNDLFGLADQGTPGGQANTQPISLDAVSELQLVVAPYDVRQSGFSGGGINVITRSGANRFSGTAYLYNRNEGLVGRGIDDVPIATFFDRQQGASVGGPLVRNRAFFFANVETQRRETPAGYSLDGSSGVDFGHFAAGQQIVDVARARYGYDIPGGFGEYTRGNPNDKIFVRADVNLSAAHRLSVRHNYVNANAEVGSQSNFRYRFADNFYLFESRTNSTVAQLNSTFGNAFNLTRVSYQRVRDRRGPQTAPFPQITIDLEGGEEIRFGTEQFSTANRLDQDILEIHNDLTWVRGRHQFTIGTHNELFRFDNLFIRDNFGVYEFTSPELFAQGLAQSYSYSFSRTADPRQAAEFWVYQLGFYAGDQWRVRDDLSLTYGIRLDAPIFPDTPSANPLVESLYGRGTDVVPRTRNWSPRIGFNYDLSPRSQDRQQVRGGLGLFHGRTPYVWLSNQYSNTGNEFQRIRVFFDPANRIPFSADPSAQPTDIGSASTNEINLVDPDYRFPQLLRGNLAYDRELGFFNLVGSVELLFSKTVRDIDYRNLNLVASGAAPDGRPTHSRLHRDFSNVVLLTNTSHGSSWTVATKLDKQFSDNWFLSGSYLYGASRAVNDGGSSQATSNWRYVYNDGDPNAVRLSVSDFSPGHRATLSGSYRIPAGPAGIRLATYYSAQQGRPYSYLDGSDNNGDGTRGNDLLYVPRDASDVIVTNGTFDDLMRFLSAGCDVTPGAILARNACRGPWIHSLDFRLGVDVPIGRNELEFFLDVQNLINALDARNGLVEFAFFQNLQPVRSSVDPATGRYVYSLNSPARPGFTGDRYARDDLRSRWQAQFGVRYSYGR